MRTCGSCDHYRKLSATCRAKSPTSVAIPVGQDALGHIQLHVKAVWPPVSDGEAACGEYRAMVTL